MSGVPLKRKRLAINVLMQQLHAEEWARRSVRMLLCARTSCLRGMNSIVAETGGCFADEMIRFVVVYINLLRREGHCKYAACCNSKVNNDN